MNEINKNKQRDPAETHDKTEKHQNACPNNNHEDMDQEEKNTLPNADHPGTPRLFTIGLRLVFTTLLLTSIGLTFTVTGIGNLVWHRKAQGSLLELNGTVVGSKLIGQSFDSKTYFHPRPSSTNFNAMKSGSANLSPQNKRLIQRAREVLKELKRNGVRPGEVPVSFVTESGSALDPHIVPQSAYIQVPRVSDETGIAPERLRNIIKNRAQPKLFGLYGLNRVNVLTLNRKIKQILEVREDE